MEPVDSLFHDVGTLLAADASGIAGNVVVSLIKVAFLPGESTLTLVAGDQADFDGYAQLAAAAATRKSVIDPATGDQIVSVLPPAGGWRWQTTGNTHLPETIYGFALQTGTVGAIFPSTVIASELFDSPVQFTGFPQELVIPEVSLRVPYGSIK